MPFRRSVGVAMASVVEVGTVDVMLANLSMSVHVRSAMVGMAVDMIGLRVELTRVAVAVVAVAVARVTVVTVARVSTVAGMPVARHTVILGVIRATVTVVGAVAMVVKVATMGVMTN